jgi:hypothetical protein
MSEDLNQSRLLNVSVGNRLQIQSHFSGGMACKRGGVDGVSWHPRGLETSTVGDGATRLSSELGGQPRPRGAQRKPQPRVDPTTTKGVSDLTAAKAMTSRTGGQAHYDWGRVRGMPPHDGEQERSEAAGRVTPTMMNGSMATCATSDRDWVRWQPSRSKDPTVALGFPLRGPNQTTIEAREGRSDDDQSRGGRSNSAEAGSSDDQRRLGLAPR